MLHVAGVDAEEHIALVDGVALLKGGLQDLAPDQRGDFVGVLRRDGSGARYSDGQVLYGGRDGEVAPAHGGGSAAQAAFQYEGQDGHHDDRDDKALDPLALLWGA